MTLKNTIGGLKTCKRHGTNEELPHPAARKQGREQKVGGCGWDVLLFFALEPLNFRAARMRKTLFVALRSYGGSLATLAW